MELLAELLVSFVIDIAGAQGIVWGLGYEHVSTGLAGVWLIVCAVTGLVIATNRLVL